nr:twin transmembrane helix small protein [Hoeflea sp.]
MSSQGNDQMSSVTYVLSIIVMLAVAAVLVRGLVNMARGGSGNLSNKLMQMRVLLQFVAVVLIVVTVWLTGGGR